MPLARDYSFCCLLSSSQTVLKGVKPVAKVVFMGTPDFAVPTLQELVESGFPVVAVITAPDKPAGRGLKLVQSPVKEYALSRQIPVLQPTNLKDEAFLEELRSYRASLQVIVAFRMLPEAVWAMPDSSHVPAVAALRRRKCQIDRRHSIGP